VLKYVEKVPIAVKIMNTKRYLRVIVADDHATIRRGIRRILEKDSNFCVIAESSTGAEAIRLVHELQPDVLLLDIEMPDMKGYQVARELRACRVQVLILALSTNDEDCFIEEVKLAGIDGYVNKSEAPQKIKQALHAISEKRSTVAMNPN
jgi:DNA-binding NarL/FixJ family response regulator